MTGGMPRDFVNLNEKAGDFKSLVVAKHAIGGGADQVDAKAPLEVFLRVDQLVGLRFPHQNRQIRPPLLEGGIAGNVVGMAVCQQDGLRGEIVRFDHIDDRVGLESWIKHQADSAIGPRQHVAIFSKRRGFDARQAQWRSTSERRHVDRVQVCHRGCGSRVVPPQHVREW